LLKHQRYLDILKQTEIHRNLKNKLSDGISKIKGGERDKLISEATKVKSQLKKLEGELESVKKSIDELLPHVPNINSEEMPMGKDAQDNVVLKVWFPKVGYLKLKSKKYSDISYLPKDEFVHKDHAELGEALDVIDIEQSAKVSGSRFGYIKNELALVQDAISLLLKRKLLESGFKPLIPPVLVKEKSLFGTSHFPEGKDQVYKIENYNVEEGNELYLVGSSEPANFSYFMDKVLEASDLPIKIYAQTPCFRSEVGSWGKDVRGIKRVHQFDKLEINAICAEGQDRKVFDEFLSINEWMLQQLELPYRIVNKCSGDSGYPATYYQYDWEYWRPKEKEFMEGGTNTMATDYQARRLNIKYRDGNTLKFVCTVNDTGFTTRSLIAILENHQNTDGSVNVPKCLVSYTGFNKMLPKNKK